MLSNHSSGSLVKSVRFWVGHRLRHARRVTSACRLPCYIQDETTVSGIFHSQGSNPQQLCSFCSANPGRCLRKQKKKQNAQAGLHSGYVALKKGFSAICRVRRKKKHSNPHPPPPNIQNSRKFLFISFYFFQMQFPQVCTKAKKNKK